ncbi:MAG: protein kinase [Bacteroidetes bacterium]|nr:protein kinase [Bacteroidota bacterium]MBU1114988.1 protein kinase [Bacteroidota bacterium]MBU1797518.1 protein kinase [Bacteroidota bacterium]
MDSLINRKIENFTIISLLGKGGMGVVYKAFDEKLNRYVAIKVLNAPNEKNSNKMIERFKSEARNHAQLIHQNIVTVYGFIEFDSQFGIVMEYVDGESLEKVIFKNHHLHIFDVIFIMNQLLDGIGYAHSKGYIHRDIKPSNIIVNSEGVVKIMDFGISKSIEGDFDPTQTSVRIGTIYYMSPEQIKGKNVNKASDIYAIGCTIYDMLTGQPPFDSKNEFEVMEAHLNENPISLTNYLPQVPHGLDEIVSKLLKKKQEERYQTCSEVKEDIQQFDNLLKTADANYFNEKKARRILSKKKSIFSFIVFIFLFISLVVFVFFQVRDFMVFKGYEVFKEHSISTLFETEQKIRLSKIVNISLPTKITLNSILTDGRKFTIVGDSGIIISKENATSDWEVQKLDEKINLNSFWVFPSGNEIFIGDRSSFVYNTNGNKQWYSILDKNYFLSDISFISDTFGIIVGSNGLVLITKNGGKRWDKSNALTKESLLSVNLRNEEIGYIVGFNGIILKTIDGCETWTNLSSNTQKYLKSIDFFDEELGICVGGSGTILRTTNGGNEWETISGITTRALNQVKFIDKMNVIIIGNNGTILLSSDSGKNWNSVESKYFHNWNDISITPNGKIYLVGSNGTMIELENGEE